MIKSKLHNTGTTIFSVMSALAAKHNAINLSQGFPGFPISSKLIDLVNKYMSQGFNQYAPMQGILPLRERIAEKSRKLYAASYDPVTDITITAGGTQAIYTAITAVVREKDEVILFDPSYDCYTPAIELNGGVPVRINLNGPDFKINWEEVRKRVNSRTRMIMINTPHNPCGSVLTKDDMEELIKITDGSDIIVLSDEVYEHIIFDGQTHESVSKYPKLLERSFVVLSFGKTFHATGWKMGYCLAPENLMNEFRKVHQYIVFSVNTAVQYALAEFMEDESNYMGLQNFYQEKRDLFLSLIKDSEFKPLKCNGSYFQLLDYSAISTDNDVNVAEKLTIEHGVASIPISVFYQSPPEDKILRFCFAKNEDVLKSAAEKLCAIKNVAV